LQSGGEKDKKAVFLISGLLIEDNKEIIRDILSASKFQVSVGNTI